jgi:hypothetical protein
LLFEKRHQACNQCPEANDGLGCHELVMITAEQVFGVLEEGFNGLITNDKFCMIRWGSVELSWWRRPLRLRDGSG